MLYRIRTEKRKSAGDFDATVLILENTSGDASAEILPALGFNCFRWQIRTADGLLDLLYSDPTLFEAADPRPTRSGIPILFPFPNRIRDGKFSWAGRDYQLPTNDPAKKNAIHGFACRRPWRMIEQGADTSGAWITAEFHGSLDAPESKNLWPADYRIRLTYRLGDRSLRIEARVDNPDCVPLPFGLGYHPYFRVPVVPGGTEQECLVQATADTIWELTDCLPTGVSQHVKPAKDPTKPRPCGELTLDDLFSVSSSVLAAAKGDLVTLGSLQQPPGTTLRVLASPSFREIVMFNPPHRQAICIEPYTCITDAVNLQQRGVDAGWLVLEPGQEWAGVVELQV